MQITLKYFVFGSILSFFDLKLNGLILKLAAIDIGSNAIRLQISNVLEHNKKIPVFKKLEYIRFPLRLGQDVFTIGEISPKKQGQFVQLMTTYKILMDLYEVDQYRACATSAMREANNGNQLVELIKDQVGIDIEIISGQQEAELFHSSIQSYLKDQTFLHIDVGGGSTELNLYVDSEKINSQSFQAGSVRTLEHSDNPEVWTEMEVWVKENIKKKHGGVTAIGTGGNINKIYDLAQKKIGNSISLIKVKKIKKLIESYDYQERQNYLQLNPDRADVILPAAKIYINVMEWAGANHIAVPNVGLKDGIILDIYQNYKR